MKRFNRTPSSAVGLPEFVMLVAALFSLMAFSIDSILPALPEIANRFVPDNVNRAQLLIGVFLIGSGIGQLIFGPICDSLGRRLGLSIGIFIYILASFAAMTAQSLETLLFWRFIQGIGIAGPRITGMAITRDLYVGREMARISSMVFGVFVFVPAIAPMCGQWIIQAFGWRHLFTCYIICAALVLFWFLFRQPETLAPEHKRPLSAKPILRAFTTVFTTRITLLYMAVITLAFGQLIGFISSAQQIYVDVLGVGDRFPYYFAMITVFSAIAGFINAKLVLRFGMRKLALIGFGAQTLLAFATLMFWWGVEPEGGTALWMFSAWATSLFFLNGLSFGNLNALAIAPLGHIAGTASAVIGAVPTIFAMVIATLIGQSFNDTPFALLIGVTICSGLAVLIIRQDKSAQSET